MATSPSFRSQSTSGGITAASDTISKPSGIAAGDILLYKLYLETDTASAITPPSGWTLIRSLTQTGPAIDYRTAWYWKRAGDSEPASYTFSGWSSNYYESIIAAYQGAIAAGTPYEGEGGTVNAGQNDPPTAPSVTTTGLNRLIVAAYSTFDGGGAIWAPGSSGMTEDVDQISNAFYSVLQPAAGASGSLVVSCTGGINPEWHAGLSLALLPNLWEQEASDDFERAALGSNWTHLVGSAVTIVGSSDLGTTGSAQQEVYYNAGTFGADQYAEGVISNLSGEPGVNVRCATSGGYSRYGLYVQGAGGYNAIEKTVDGSWTQLASLSSPPVVGAKIRLEAEGTSLRAYVNGVLQATATDTSHTTGRPGAGFYNGNAGSLIESWAAGDLGAFADQVTFVGAGAAAYTATSGANLSPGLPAGWAPDDIHILVGTRSDNTAGTTPTGWTPITGLAGNNTTAYRVEAYWRRAVAGDTAPVYTFGTGTIVRGARIYGLRGCATTGDPFDTGTGAPTRANTASGAVTSFTNLTTTVPGTLSLAVAAFEDDPSAVTTMAGYTQPAGAVAASALGTDQSQAYMYRLLPLAAGAGATSVTWSGGSFTGPSVGLLIALIPPAPTGPIAATISATGAAATGFASTYRRSATGAFSGVGATSVAARQRQRATIAAAGAASTSFAARIRQRATATAAGAASTSLATAPRHRAVVSATGAAATSLTARIRLRATAAATGASAGSLAASVRLRASGALTGPAGTALAALIRLRATAAATGAAATGFTATYTGPVTSNAAGSLSGAGSTDLAGRIRWRATLLPTGDGATALTARLRTPATATATGAAATAFVARLRLPASVAAAGAGLSQFQTVRRTRTDDATFESMPVVSWDAAGPASTDYAATYTPPVTDSAAGSFAGAAAANLDGRIRWRATLLPAGAGASVFAAQIRGPVAMAAAGAGSVTVVARIRRPAAGSLAGAGAVTLAVRVRLPATLAAAGPAATSLASRLRWRATLAATGAGAAALTARQRQRTTGALTGAAATAFAVTFTPPVGQATGNLTGAAATSLTGRQRQRAAGGATGAASASVSAATWGRATATASGPGSAVFVARIRQRPTGEIAGAADSSVAVRVRYRLTPAASGGSLTSLNVTAAIRPGGTLSGGSATLFAASVRGVVAGEPGDVRAGSGRIPFRVRAGSDAQGAFAAGSGTARGG